MNIKSFAIGTVAVFAFVFVYEWLVHGYLLMGFYQETPHLWRSPEESCMLAMTLSQIAFAAVMAYIFHGQFAHKDMKNGLRFGVDVGLILGSVQIATCGYMPISCMLTAAWVATSFLKGLGAGAVLALVNRD